MEEALHDTALLREFAKISQGLTLCPTRSPYYAAATCLSGKTLRRTCCASSTTSWVRTACC